MSVSRPHRLLRTTLPGNISNLWKLILKQILKKLIFTYRVVVVLLDRPTKNYWYLVSMKSSDEVK